MKRAVDWADAIEVDYFDGSSSRRHRVYLRVDAQSLLIAGDGVSREVPLHQVRWPERARHGARVAYFDSHGNIQCTDSVAWDRWIAAYGPREPYVVRLQQSWRWVVASVAATVLLLSLAYNWALPAVAQVVLRATPLSVDASVGASALLTLDQSGSTQASSMPVAKQMALETELRTELSSLRADLPYWKVVFRESGMGANAFALPGGTIVVTDKMVELCDGSSKFLSAVLAHELGHLYHRHGMLLLTQVGALGIAASAIWGDFSGTLASVPVLLGAAGYSRDAEREADAFAAKVLIGLHRSPLEMVDVLKALERERQGATSAESGDTKYNLLAIAFASHPIDVERQNFFRSVGGGQP